eukprot:GHVU01038856.1.p1 GENE.GHVU01038856.1~~GHVU01038856.1.p1  ORF type:complete len:183 (+),score=24.22 GHVU01038856.1:609-1157(+)
MDVDPQTASAEDIMNEVIADVDEQSGVARINSKNISQEYTLQVWYSKGETTIVNHSHVIKLPELPRKGSELFSAILDYKGTANSVNEVKGWITTDNKTLLYRNSLGKWKKVEGNAEFKEDPLKTLTLLALGDKGACALCSDVAADIPDFRCIYLPLPPSLTSFAVSEASGRWRRRCTGQSSM